jgi:hypothetical protein
MIAMGAPFGLGAWMGRTRAVLGCWYALAPGPLRGLLHAPSPRGLTAAVLRVAAVHIRERPLVLTVDPNSCFRCSPSACGGLHPYEALGLEVEKLAETGCRSRYCARVSLAADVDQQERRVCDGQQVLRAAREGALVAGLPPDLPARLAPLDEVLDTYSDLLVADGVFALVTGRADLANAAMEAAAGLGAPPELRSIRTPRQATTVRVTAWALLPPGDGGEDDPAEIADPAFAAALNAEFGAAIISAVDDASREKRNRFAVVLGGAGEEAALPSLTGGEYEGLPDSADADLRRAIQRTCARVVIS